MNQWPIPLSAIFRLLLFQPFLPLESAVRYSGTVAFTFPFTFSTIFQLPSFVFSPYHIFFYCISFLPSHVFPPSIPHLSPSIPSKVSWDGDSVDTSCHPLSRFSKMSEFPAVLLYAPLFAYVFICPTVILLQLYIYMCGIYILTVYYYIYFFTT